MAQGMKDWSIVVDADPEYTEKEYIAWVKQKNAFGIKIIAYVETYVNSGDLTVDDVAGFLNDVVPYRASATYFSDYYSTSFVVQLVNNANMSIGVAASILNDSNISADRVAEILNASNMSVDKAAEILNNTNMSVDKAAEILSSSSISADRVYDILANANLSADRTQSILYAMPFSSRLVDIVTHGAPNETITTSTTITGVNRYNVLEVKEGAILTVDGEPGVIIAKKITVIDSIVKTATGGAGGAAGGPGGGAGGAGGGTLILFTDELLNEHVISAPGECGEDGSTTDTSAHGEDGDNGGWVRVGNDAAGTGGAGGGDAGGAGNAGGGGGGEGAFYGGAGGYWGYVDYFTYDDVAEDVKKAVTDWFQINILAKTPSTRKYFTSSYGAGGGGGAVDDTWNAGGGGGGAGGGVIIEVMSFLNLGTIEAPGGDGGNGGTEGTADCAGSGGGGGIVYVLYNFASSVGTLSAPGGSGGTGDNNGNPGTAGTAKAVQIQT